MLQSVARQHRKHHNRLIYILIYIYWWWINGDPVTVYRALDCVGLHIRILINNTDTSL